MKLASLKTGRDGQLVVVSRDLTRAAPASGVAARLQDALDGWETCAPKLEELYARQRQLSRAAGADSLGRSGLGL